MRKIRAIVVALVLLSASSASSFISAQSEKFGKNNVIWRDGEPNFYQSEHFDVWTWMDLKDPKQAEHFRKFMENIENACSFLGSKKMYDHILSKRLPIIVFNTHSEWASGKKLPPSLLEAHSLWVLNTIIGSRLLKIWSYIFLLPKKEQAFSAFSINLRKCS